MYIYIYHVLHAFRQGCKVRAPYQWKHANLEPIREFLKEQIALGNYVPAFDFDSA